MAATSDSYQVSEPQGPAVQPPAGTTSVSYDGGTMFVAAEGGGGGAASGSRVRPIGLRQGLGI